MRLAYVRVSTVDQCEDRQKESLKAYNIEKWFEEKVSAKDTNRPQLQALLDFAREGDTIYVHDFSRLARSTKDLLDIIEKCTDKGITVFSTKEQFDTSTPTGKLMLTMIGAINEFERANILERQREGIALARMKGKYAGRKKIKRPKDFEIVYKEWKCRNITGREAMRQLGLKRTKFYEFIREYEGVANNENKT